MTDVSAISELVLTCCQRFIFPGTLLDGIRHLENLYSEKNLKGLLQSGNTFLISHVDDELVGSVAMLKERQHIFLMFVSERFQGRGIGRALMQHLFSTGLEKTIITLNSSLYAVEFYRHLGFTASGPVTHKGGLDFLPMELIVEAT